MCFTPTSISEYLEGIEGIEVIAEYTNGTTRAITVKDEDGDLRNIYGEEGNVDSDYFFASDYESEETLSQAAHQDMVGQGFELVSTQQLQEVTN